MYVRYEKLIKLKKKTPLNRIIEVRKYVQSLYLSVALINIIADNVLKWISYMTQDGNIMYVRRSNVFFFFDYL